VTVLDWSRPLVPGAVVRDDRVAPRASWSAVVPAGRVLTIVDVGGNQSADCLLFDAADPAERYSVPDTLAWSGNAYVRTGTVLRSNRGNPLMTVVGNEVDRQDTIGGACSKESNTLRYGHHTAADHACRENFLSEGAKWGLGVRDLVSNLNWFMNVPVEADGSLGIVDGLSAPGKRVAIRAERDVLVVVSNCPQMNNPCNAFDPTPLRMIVTASGAAPQNAQENA
jgi:urea carboxylase-associated protein 1